MRSAIFLVGAVVLLNCVEASRAHVSSGGTCANCHSSVSGRATIDSPLATDATHDPGIPTGLKKFVGYPGGVVRLSVNVTNGGSTNDQYAPALTGLNSPTTDVGLLSPTAHTLTFTPDSAWTARGSGTSSYATQGPFSWSGSTARYSYTVNSDPTSGLDYYLLNFTVAGRDSSIGRWCQPQNFVLQIALGGDANLDGRVDITDLGLLATNWQSAAFWTGGDFNSDGLVDISDLGVLATNWQAGVGNPTGPSLDEALATVGLSGVTVPEPSVISAALAVAATAVYRRRRQ